MLYRIIVRGWTKYFYRYLIYKEGNFIHTGICYTSLSCIYTLQLFFKAKHRCTSIILYRSLAALGSDSLSTFRKHLLPYEEETFYCKKIMYFVKLWPINFGHLKKPDLKYIYRIYIRVLIVKRTDGQTSSKLSSHQCRRCCHIYNRNACIHVFTM